jgi:hypothetical protein
VRKEVPKANPRCVGLKCEVKDIFNKELKSAVLKQIKQSIPTLVDKTKGLLFELQERLDSDRGPAVAQVGQCGQTNFYRGQGGHWRRPLVWNR